MSQTNIVRFQDKLVNAKRKLNVVKIVDAAKTAQDLLPYQNPVTGLENPGQARTIYSSVYMTFGPSYMTSSPSDGANIDIPIYETIHPINDIRTWGDHTNQNVNNLNAVLEIPGGSNLIYEDQNEDNGRFAPYETDPGADPTALQDLGFDSNGLPIVSPAALSYGFVPRTVSDPTYNYNAPGVTWMTGLPAEVNGETYYNSATAYFGDGDALDIIVAGQKPDGNGGFGARDILEIVKVRAIAVAVGAEQKPGIPANFESIVIAIAHGDTRFDGINTITQWRTAAAAPGADPVLSLTLGTMREFVRVALNWLTFTWANFKDSTYANNLINFQHQRFLQNE
jgi:inorganic pyrophosphatase